MSIQSLESLLAETDFPEAALKPLLDKVHEYVAMVAKSNGLVASVNAAKAQDPSNVDFLDSLWKSKAVEGNEKVAEKAEQFHAIAEEYERLLKELRSIAKDNFIPEQLSEEKARDARKAVNDMAPTISKSREGITAMLVMPESVLKAKNVEMPGGGLASLLPEAESLKSPRGRKASSGEGYVTRVGDVLVEGKTTQRNGKGKFDYAAEMLSERFGAKNIPQNKVTKEELEEAFFAAGLKKPFRSVKSTELPDETTFVFEKTIQVQNGNDDSFREEPQKVTLTVRSVNYAPKTETESAPAENAKPATPEKSANTEKPATPAKKTEPAKK